MARFAFAAVHERVGKTAKVAGCNPSLRIHENCAVQTDIIRAFLNELLAPCVFDVGFQLNAEGAVVPSVCKSAVNFTSGVYKASALAKSNKLFHCFFCVFH